ncbi:hypothetical protein EAG_16184 [Camponotus floridanus]|uniref:Uncharacterized protein n=1 Tax=Camponotus floridanus TaxID=104421 RepID=E2AGK3_CAMFO|nr:hypothetical protein EAG_16184 [Camponotus floridanus]
MVWVMPVVMGMVTVFGALLAGRQFVPVMSVAAGGSRGGSRGSRGAEKPFKLEYRRLAPELIARNVRQTQYRGSWLNRQLITAVLHLTVDFSAAQLTTWRSPGRQHLFASCGDNGSIEAQHVYSFLGEAESFVGLLYSDSNFRGVASYKHFEVSPGEPPHPGDPAKTQRETMTPTRSLNRACYNRVGCRFISAGPL